MKTLPYDPNRYAHDPRKRPLTPKQIMALDKLTGLIQHVNGDIDMSKGTAVVKGKVVSLAKALTARKPKPRKMTKAEVYEAATAPVSDIETIIDELDQVEAEAPESMQDAIGRARAYLGLAVKELMDLPGGR